MLTGLSGNGHDTRISWRWICHGELHRLSSVVEETIDGARVFGVTEADRPLVRAFMKGVNDDGAAQSSITLGLDTLVTPDDSGLAIQTDLGSTESQFVVVTVTGLSVMVTYTDVHPRRVRFLQDMLRTYGVQWSAVVASPGADYDVSVRMLHRRDARGISNAI